MAKSSDKFKKIIDAAVAPYRNDSAQIEKTLPSGIDARAKIDRIAEQYKQPDATVAHPTTDPAAVNARVGAWVRDKRKRPATSHPYREDGGHLTARAQYAQKSKLAEIDRKIAELTGIEAAIYGDKSLDALRRERAALTTYDDNFGGQTAANYTRGRLAQDQSLAWYNYISSQSDADRAYAEEIDRQIAKFQQANAPALASDATLPWISQSLANYLPQLEDQLAENAAGAAIGGAFGTLVAPGAGTVAGMRLGTVAGSGSYSYKTMRGAAFKALLDLGVDEKIAAEASSDEAVISAIIEMGDTAIDLVALTGGKAFASLGSEGLKGLAKKIAATSGKSLAAKFAVGLAKYGLDIGGEALEEGTQEAVSIANADRFTGPDAKGLDAGLLGTSAAVFWDAVTGKNKSNSEQIFAAAAEGAKIAAMMGGSAMIANSTAGSYVSDASVGAGLRSADPDIAHKLVSDMLTGDRNGKSYKLASAAADTLGAGKPLSDAGIGALYRAYVANMNVAPDPNAANENEAERQIQDPALPLVSTPNRSDAAMNPTDIPVIEPEPLPVTNERQYNETSDDADLYSSDYEHISDEPEFTYDEIEAIYPDLDFAPDDADMYNYTPDPEPAEMPVRSPEQDVSAVAQFADGLDKVAGAVLKSEYSPDAGVSSTEYIADMMSYYVKGKNGAQFAFNPEHASITPLQANAMYAAGQAASHSPANEIRTPADRKSDAGSISTIETEATINDEQANYIRSGSQRPDSADPGGQVRAVAENTRGNQIRKTKTSPADGGAAALSYGKKISTAALGIAAGSNEKAIRVVVKGETNATKQAAALAKQRGLRLVLFAGDNLKIGHNLIARACIIGDRAFVRVDHSDFTAEQLMLHEVGHDKIDRGEINPDDVRDRLKNAFTPAELDAIAEMYAAAYPGMTPEEAWLELICDSLGNMNIFSGRVSISADVIASTLPPIKSAVAELDAGKSPRAPPQSTHPDAKLSREADSLDALKADNDYLRRRVDYWKGQLKRTKPDAVTLRQSDVDKLARSLIKNYASELDVDDISTDLKSLGEFVLRGGDEHDELTYSGIKDKAVSIARDIVNNASVLVSDGTAEIYQDIKKYLRKTKLSFSDHGDIAELLDGMDQIYANPHSEYISETIECCANEIIDALIGESVRQTPPTFAAGREAAKDAYVAGQMVQGAQMAKEMRIAQERSAKRLAAAKQETKDARAAGREATKDAVAAGREAAKDAYVAGQIAQGAQMAKEMRIAQERSAKRLAAAKQAIEREKARRTAQTAAYKSAAEAKRANVADANARTRLLKIAQRLNNRKLPAVSRALLNQYIGDLDLTAKRLTAGKAQNLAALRDWYTDQRDNNPDFISDPHIEKMIERLSKRQINDLSARDVADLTTVLKNIENALRTQKRLIDSAEKRDIYNMGAQTISDIENTAGSKGGLFDEYIVTETLSPVRQIRRMTGYVDDNPLYVITEELADGQRKMFDYQRRAAAKFSRFVDDRAFVDQIIGKHAKAIRISGIGKAGPTTVTISPAMRMSLYLHSLNDQNLTHIAGGGITVPDWTLYQKGKIEEAYARSTTIKLTPSEVRRIVSQMSAKERTFARAAHDYFNGMSRDEINAVSEKLKGYSIAEVEHYFPINTDTAFTRGDFDTIKFDGSIEGMGFLKERINAANPIMLRDLNSVLSQSIAMHARYVGLAIPVRNFNKVWGVTKSSFNAEGERNSFESSVQQAVRNKWGTAGYAYVEKMMTDVTGTRKQQDVWGRLLAFVKSNYAQAVLLLNLSVAMKQAASYPTAGAVIGFRPLARAMADFGEVNLDLIAKYTPLQWYRSQGFSTQELGDLTKKGKQLPELLNWVQGTDLITTRKLWKAAEYYIRQTDKQLKLGTDDYYAAVADIYNQIIEETQPSYTTMQRPQLLRSDDTLMQNLSMFKTQLFQNFNILYDAFGNVSAKRKVYITTGTDASKAAYTAAKTRAGWAATSQLMQLAVVAGMTFAWAMLRGKKDKYDDEQGEVTLLSALPGISKDMIGGALASVPFGSDVWELASSIIFRDTYYGLDAVAPSAIADFFDSIKKAVGAISSVAETAANGDAIDVNEQRLIFGSVAVAASKIFGVPLQNVANLFTAVYRKAAVAISGEHLGAYSTLKINSNPNTSPAAFYDVAFKAWKEKDKTQYNAICADLISHGYTQMQIDTAIRARIEKTQQFVAAYEQQSESITEDLKTSAGFDALPADYQGKALESASDYAEITTMRSQNKDYSPPSAYAWIEKADAGANVGIDTWEYILFRAAMQMADDDGSLKQAEVIDALKAMTWLSDKEKSYLFSTRYESSKNNPWA